MRLLAALSPTELEGDDLLRAARALAAATANLLNSAQPESIEVQLKAAFSYCNEI